MAQSPVRRVLVVDDEPDVRESTCLLLESMGCQAIPLADPGDVLPVAAQEQPGLILQDLKMPDLNLAGTVAALRSDPATADIPLVFFSANPDIAETARRYDAWGFLRKPFAPEALAQILEQVFGPTSSTDPQRKVREAFHDQWNILSAIANYAHMLRLRAEDPGSQRAAQKLEGQLLRLEASIDRLHTFVSQVVEDAAPPMPAPARASRPPRPGHRTSAPRPEPTRDSLAG